MKRKYHGWIVVEEKPSGEPKYSDIFVEYEEGGERKKDKMPKLGNSGCAQAVEWWDRKVGSNIKLEPMLKGCFRVYTEE